ncbi:hypothetical protein BD289DRAFT_480965 [Coniella lustricola]|uniref:Ribosomal protein/NADH dehydrogenase domain-containing protein n=1 Tax=Coniella lustricola TaxID=2025994 RepID=A0A2T3ADT6_9PEZI|nr:hypothetical protein BD289DRAFT_480965 [Coniella lustricola]
MSAIGRRMNKLKSLISVRHGPGAAILPINITKIHLEFAHKWDGGHYGSRKFWKDHLPRLKFHNPAVPMIVNRVRDQTSAATLTIYTTSPQSSPSSSDSSQTTTPKTTAPTQPPSPASRGPIKKPIPLTDAWTHIASSTEGEAPAPPPAAGESIITINMKNVESHDILKQFLERTGAVEVVPTEEEAAEMRRLNDLEKQSEVDRAVQKAYRDNIQREKKMLERARQEANALKAEN